MKNIKLLLILLLSLNLFSQESYPYKRPELMLGKTIRIVPIREGLLKIDCGYRNYYEDPKCYNIYEACDLERSRAEALSGREFKVIDIHTIKGYQSVLHVYNLEDTTNKEIVYYEYNSAYKREYDYSIEVKGGLDLSADFYCDYIETMDISATHIRHKAELTGLFSLEKVINGGETKTQLVFMSHSDNFAGKGYVIELADGQVIKDAIYPVGQYKHNNARFFIHTLNKKDTDMLSNSRVVKVTMGNIKIDIDAKFSMLLQGAMSCMASK